MSLLPFSGPKSGGGGMAIGGSVTSGTAGSVLYINGSGNLAQDNSNLYWDGTNHRLGIGTSTFSTSNKLLVGAYYTATATAMMQISTTTNLTRGLVIQGAVGQARNLLEWQKSDGTVYGYVNETGGAKVATLGINADPITQAQLIIAAGGLQAFIVSGVDSIGSATHFGIQTGSGALGAGNTEYWNSYKDGNGWVFNSTSHGTGTTRSMRFIMDDAGNPLLYLDPSRKVGILTSSFGTNSLLAIGNYNIADNLANVMITTSASTNKALVIQGSTSQTANIFETQSVSGVVMTYINPSGSLGVRQGATSSTAYLHIAAGSATASTAPIKLTSGTNLTTGETGAIEYNGTNLFFTRTGTTREAVLVGNDAASAPSTTPTPVFSSFYGGNTKVLGDPNSWASVVINGTTYKIALYT